MREWYCSPFFAREMLKRDGFTGVQYSKIEASSIHRTRKSALITAIHHLRCSLLCKLSGENMMNCIR
jgi:hypothetical protein